MSQAVVADADMLFGRTTRALFIYLRYADALKLHWSQRILTEMSAALVRTGRKLTLSAAEDNERQMNQSVDDALLAQAKVDQHEAAMLAFVTDPGDAHVVACAYELVSGGYYPADTAIVLSTRNLDDYKIEELLKEGITVMHPDAFLMSLPLESVAEALRAFRGDLSRAPAPTELLGALERDGNPQITEALRAAWTAGVIVL